MTSTPTAGPSGTVTNVEYGPDSGGRLKGVTVVKPIVVGNVAKYFGKKREEDGHTHSWTVYVKPYLNEDYSVFIKKVHFKLHDSYGNPNRIVTKPPYEVQETGWGEFEVVIKIYFNDPVERPVTLYHILKLFQNSGDMSCPSPGIKKPLVSEVYDEIVFQEPTALMKSLLDSITPLNNNGIKHDVDFEEKKKATLDKLEDSRKKVKDEIHILKERLTSARETIETYRTAIIAAQNAPPGSASSSPKKVNPETPRSSPPKNVDIETHKSQNLIPTVSGV